MAEGETARRRDLQNPAFIFFLIGVSDMCPKQEHRHIGGGLH